MYIDVVIYTGVYIYISVYIICMNAPSGTRCKQTPKGRQDTHTPLNTRRRQGSANPSIVFLPAQHRSGPKGSLENAWAELMLAWLTLAINTATDGS